MTTKFNLDRLFDNFYSTSKQALSTFEMVFEVSDVCNQFFGQEVTSHHIDYKSEAEKESMNRVRRSSAWRKLDTLFQYAVHGKLGEEGTGSDIVIDGSEVISFLEIENSSPSSEWKEIVSLGDGRFSLDAGDSIDIHKLALLANVDVRTVRNAISAGELISFKHADTNSIHVENTSSRNWLAGRRGFVPTTSKSPGLLHLKDVRHPYELGSLIKERRILLGLSDSLSHVMPPHTSITAVSLKELETGAFKMPLDTVFPLAEYLQFDRKEFLECVMRVYFSEELDTLSGNSDHKN